MDSNFLAEFGSRRGEVISRRRDAEREEGQLREMLDGLRSRLVEVKGTGYRTRSWGSLEHWESSGPTAVRGMVIGWRSEGSGNQTRYKLELAKPGDPYRIWDIPLETTNSIVLLGEIENELAGYALNRN